MVAMFQDITERLKTALGQASQNIFLLEAKMPVYFPLQHGPYIFQRVAALGCKGEGPLLLHQVRTYTTESGAAAAQFKQEVSRQSLGSISLSSTARVLAEA